MEWVWVFAGGGSGAVCRHLIAKLSERFLGTHFPWGTLLANSLGCLAIGLAVAWVAARPRPEVLATARLLVVTGFLGGFTTYSTFSLQTIELAREGRLGIAVLNALGTLALCLLATLGGLELGRYLTQPPAG